MPSFMTKAKFKLACESPTKLWYYERPDKYANNEGDLVVKPDDKPGLSGSERQWLQIAKIKNDDNSLWVDEEGLRNEIQSWTYPLHFIDFETAMLPISFKKGAHPYQDPCRGA